MEGEELWRKSERREERRTAAQTARAAMEGERREGNEDGEGGR